MPSLRQLLQRRSAKAGQSGTLRVGFGTQWSARTWGYARTLDSVVGNATGFRCLEVITSNASRPPFEIRKPGTDERIEGHRLLEVLNHPDDSTSATMFQAQMVRDLELAGKSVWVRSAGVDGYGDAGPLTGLKRLPIQQVTIMGDENDQLIGFIYADRMGVQTPLLPAQVLYLRYPHPDRAYDGLAPASIALLGAESDSVAARFNYDLLSNDGALPGYITLEGLTPEQFQEWQALWMAQERPGATRFMSGNATYHKVGSTNEELSFKDLRTASQEDVHAAMGVPRVMVNPSEATFANARAARASFFQQTMLPKLTLIADEMTMQLGSVEGVDIGFDLSQIEELGEGLAALVERSVPLLDRQVVTINEVRRDMGYDPVDWGDEPVQQKVAAPVPVQAPDEVLPPPDNAFPPQKPLTQAGQTGQKMLMEGGNPSEDDKAPEKPERADTPPPVHPIADLPNRLRAFWDRQGKAVSNRLRKHEGKSYEKAVDPENWWDSERWESDLALVTSEPGEINQKTYDDLVELVGDNEGGLVDVVGKVEAYFAGKQLQFMDVKALEPIPAQSIVVNTPAIEQPAITVNVPEAAAPAVNVAAPEVHVEAPAVTVQVPEVKRLRRRVERDEQGRISAVVDEVA